MFKYADDLDHLQNKHDGIKVQGHLNRKSKPYRYLKQSDDATVVTGQSQQTARKHQKDRKQDPRGLAAHTKEGSLDTQHGPTCHNHFKATCGTSLLH